MSTVNHIGSDLRTAIESWRRRLQDKDTVTRTPKLYDRDLTTFLDVLAQSAPQPPDLNTLAELEAADFHSYFEHLRQQGKAPASIARALSVLRHFYRFLAERQGIHNPHILQIRAPRVAKGTRTALAKDAAAKAVELVSELSDAPWIAKRDEALFALLYGSGLRLSEALALNRDQAPQKADMTVGTGKRRRTVPVLPWVPKLIEDYLKTSPHHPNPNDKRQPLFVGARGKRLNPGVVQRQMRRLRLLLGLPIDTTPTVYGCVSRNDYGPKATIYARFNNC